MSPRSTAWEKKQPAEMTLEELQTASEAINERYAVAEAEYRNLQLTKQHLDAEVASRFNMQGLVTGSAGLPEYPLGFVSGEEPVNGAEDAANGAE